MPLSEVDRDAAIRTVLTEAHADPTAWASVASTIANRQASGQYGNSIYNIVTAPNQFEVWSNGRAQKVTTNDPNYAAAGRIVDATFDNQLPDPTNGATHFYAPAAQAALGRQPPSWGTNNQPTASVGGHLFYAPNGGPVQRGAGQQAIATVTAPTAASAPTASTDTPQPLDDSVLKQFDVGSTPAAASTPAASTSVPAATSAKSSLSQASMPEPVDDSVLTQFDVAKPNGGAPADINNVPTPANDPIYHGAVPIAAAPDQGASTAFGSGIQGVPIVGPAISGLIQKGAAAARSLTNDTRYSDELRNVQEMTDVARVQHPYVSTAGDLTAGGAAMAGLAGVPVVGAAIKGAEAGPLWLRAASAIPGNALIGGVDAKARGNNVVEGAALGGAGGAAAPIAASVGTALGRNAANAIGQVVQPAVPGLGRATSNMLAKVVDADGADAVRNRLTQLGPLGMIADAGPSSQAIAGGLVTEPSAAKSTIIGNLNARTAGANDRVNAAIDRMGGPADALNNPDPQVASNNIKAARSEIDNANYTAVHGQNVPVDVSGVVQMIDDKLPTATGSQKAALKNFRSQLVDKPAIPATDTTAAQPETYQTSSELLHNLRQEADAAIGGDSGLGVEASALRRANGTVKLIRNGLDDALKTQVPGMADADAISSAMAKRIDAVETGYNAVGSGKSPFPQTFADQVAANDPGTNIALAKGARGKIAEAFGRGKQQDLAKLNTLLDGSRDGGFGSQNLATIFGDEPVNNLMRTAQNESTFGNTSNYVIHNSQTAQRQGAQGLLKETQPGSMNLLGATPTGIPLQLAKSAVVNPLIKMMMENPTAPRNLELARALTAQGGSRDAIVDGVNRLIQRNNVVSSVGNQLGYNAGHVTSTLTRVAPNRLLNSNKSSN